MCWGPGGEPRSELLGAPAPEFLSRCEGGADNWDAANRVGLLRTPLSGGVANADRGRTLPSDAVAVRNLMEQARFGTLSTTMSDMQHRRAGYPLSTLVDFAADSHGRPLFSLSPMAVHTRNLTADARGSLLVTAPGWNGLANARATLFGDIYPVAPEACGAAREIFMEKHGRTYSQYTNTGNFQFWVMASIVDVYFVGGFGTVSWVAGQTYREARPDRVLTGELHSTLRSLNDKYAKPLQATLPGSEDVQIISIDQKGVEIRLRVGGEYGIRRITFEGTADGPEDAHAELGKFLDLP